jgi:putative SOS response-associated peptidase YedK
LCGRFTLALDTAQLQDFFPWLNIQLDVHPRYNIAPSQPVAVVPNTGTNNLDYYQWGLIPPWAKDPSIGNRMINARVETLSEKPSFRTAFRRKRCLILADGFFEWQKSAGQKIPIYIRMKSHAPFAFAGLWETWKTPNDSELNTCVIITTSPNELVAPIHNRMPVILPMDAFPHWLNPGESKPEFLKQLLQPFSADLMEAYPVSRMVNSPQNDTPECIHPAD